MASETHYARSADGTSIAYRVHGEGPSNLVVVPGFNSHAYGKRGQGRSERLGG